jgi:hypothetical protein
MLGEKELTLEVDVDHPIPGLFRELLQVHVGAIQYARDVEEGIDAASKPLGSLRDHGCYRRFVGDVCVPETGLR